MTHEHESPEFQEEMDRKRDLPEVAADGTPTEELMVQRRERLDNRPDNAEVDNSGREFDAEKAMFTDEPGYETAEKKFPPASEVGA